MKTRGESSSSFRHRRILLSPRFVSILTRSRSLSRVDRRNSSLIAMSGASSSSSTTTTTPRVMRVYNRRPRMTSVQQARDWASLPPPLLAKVFRSLEASDLQSAKATCRKWQAQVNNQGAVPRGGAGADPAPAADGVEVHALAESWMDTVETILGHLRDLHQVHDVEIDVVIQFLVEEGIIKTP